MKKFYCFVGTLLLSTVALAQQAEPDQQKDLNQTNVQSQLQASSEEIATIKETCESWAKDDEVEPDALYNYLLNCVNQELSYGGYATLELI